MTGFSLNTIALIGTVVMLAVTSGAAAEEKDPPADSSSVAVTRIIDERIDARLKAAAVSPSQVADDAEFLRRVHLDLHGVVPTADRVRSFLADRAADKCAKVIDELVADPRFAAHLADIWDDYLIPATDDPRADKVRLTAWLEEAFQNKSWDRITRELLTASGQRDKDAVVSYLLKGRETLSPTELTDLVSQYFMGIRLNCAQCHDHPFTNLKQTEYWGMAAFFVEIQYTDRRMQKSGLIRDDSTVAIGKLENADKLRTPKFLGGGELTLPAGVPHRQALAQWLTAADNPFFARATVNRMWAQLFGRGLVEPFDDMQQGNEPTHPELLNELSERFVASGYDLRQLCRAICNSGPYQRTSRPAAGNERDSTLYSHMAVKVLTPEQLYDSLAVVVPLRGERKGSGGNVNPREEFVQFFRSEGDPNPTAYDRGIPQLLRMMNSPQLLSSRNESATVRKMTEGATSNAQAIDGLYLHVLSRLPTDNERKILDDFLSQHPKAREEAYAEVLWSLLNSSEFTLNH